MWESVLPTLQPLADKHGFGREWQTMTKKRTEAAARAAAEAAAAWAAEAAEPAEAAARAAWAAEAAAAWQTFDPCALLAKLIDVQ
jgi:hypothetical protein